MSFSHIALRVKKEQVSSLSCGFHFSSRRVCSSLAPFGDLENQKNLLEFCIITHTFGFGLKMNIMQVWEKGVVYALSLCFVQSWRSKTTYLSQFFLPLEGSTSQEGMILINFFLGTVYKRIRLNRQGLMVCRP